MMKIKILRRILDTIIFTVIVSMLAILWFALLSHIDYSNPESGKFKIINTQVINNEKGE